MHSDNMALLVRDIYPIKYRYNKKPKKTNRSREYPRPLYEGIVKHSKYQGLEVYYFFSK